MNKNVILQRSSCHNSLWSDWRWPTPHFNLDQWSSPKTQGSGTEEPDDFSNPQCGKSTTQDGTNQSPAKSHLITVRAVNLICCFYFYNLRSCLFGHDMTTEWTHAACGGKSPRLFLLVWCVSPFCSLSNILFSLEADLAETLLAVSFRHEQENKRNQTLQS